MLSTAPEAHNEILAHIQKQGGPFPSWYCGVTENIENRLFGNHKVPEKDHWFIHRHCVDSVAARSVELELINAGCDGGTGGGDEDADHVYAYLKSSVTDP